jgi:predicted phosphoribosyltransferase
VAADFVKPIDVEKLVIAAPITTVPALDRMHILGDEIFCLGIVHNYFTTDHYYEEDDVPDHQTVVDIMKNIVLSWGEHSTETAANNSQ